MLWHTGQIYPCPISLVIIDTLLWRMPTPALNSVCSIIHLLIFCLQSCPAYRVEYSLSEQRAGRKCCGRSTQTADIVMFAEEMLWRWICYSYAHCSYSYWSLHTNLLALHKFLFDGILPIFISFILSTITKLFRHTFYYISRLGI